MVSMDKVVTTTEQARSGLAPGGWKYEPQDGYFRSKTESGGAQPPNGGVVSLRALRVRAKTTAPFGGCKPSRYGVAEIALTTSSDEARRHRLTRFSFAIRPSSYFCANPSR